jgi:heme-degrading monooxygenase HmoA
MSVLSYLKFDLASGTDVEDFERDLHAMLQLAESQPGYQWAEMGPSLNNPSVYVVVSEWDEVDHVRAWEHEEEHTGIMEKWEPRYREPLLHRRFVPWQRPGPAER